LLLLAEDDGKIIGYLSAQRGTLRRIKHTAYIVIGIRKQHQHKGIGTRLFKKLVDWAEANGIKRLELTVMYLNTSARHLYENVGFVVEGIKKRSMLVDGEYVDEYYMAKLL
jgi:RimJ/RimL family protein N-acetyltransferase